jgi:hypothetical protein
MYPCNTGTRKNGGKNDRSNTNWPRTFTYDKDPKKIMNNKNEIAPPSLMVSSQIQQHTCERYFNEAETICAPESSSLVYSPTRVHYKQPATWHGTFASS